MDHTDSHEIKGLHTWTLNPDEVIRNPIHYRWAPQHLTRTATGISFIQLPPGKATWAPHYLTHRQDPPTINPLKDYLYMEADPDEKTNTWKCRTWWNQHPKYSHPDDYLLAFTVLAATTPPTDTDISIGPLEAETPEWKLAWTAHAITRPSSSIFMTLHQFSQYAIMQRRYNLSTWDRDSGNWFPAQTIQIADE